MFQALRMTIGGTAQFCQSLGELPQTLIPAITNIRRGAVMRDF
jgi:hypothetical protein